MSIQVIYLPKELLDSLGASPTLINVMKVIREGTGLGLKESADLARDWSAGNLQLAIKDAAKVERDAKLAQLKVDAEEAAKATLALHECGNPEYVTLPTDEAVLMARHILHRLPD